MKKTINLIAFSSDNIRATGHNVIELANDADPRVLALNGVARIDLNFPKFTDGRAYSQAFLLRRRLGFKGELRATGDVLIDQLQLMQRSGFDTAVLRADQNLDSAQRQLGYFNHFYQGDAVQPRPVFASNHTTQGANV
ncbi:MAG: DUF934 domain-containing protein [Comamonadaceae bacterium]|nr:DUF934 domain-containing protein [Comamonadaceae bacterium]